MTDRRRNALILLIVAGLVAGSLAAILAKKTLLGLDLKGGVELVYQAKPTAQSKLSTESLERAITIMRKRVDQLGVAQPEIQSSGEDQIDVALPDVQNAERAQNEVGKTAQLQFYDWEPNVIGPTGEPAPSEGSVTGDTTRQGAGGAVAGLLEYQAVLRAAKRKPILRHNETTWSRGLHAGAGQGLPVRQLVPARHRPRTRRAGAGRNRTQPVHGPPHAAEGHEARGRAREPGNGARAGARGGNRSRKGHQPLAQQLVRAQRQPGAERRRHHQPDAGQRRIHRAAERDLRLQLARQDGLRTRHQGNRSPRPGSRAAWGYQRTGDAALRGRARRPADHGALDRLHASTPKGSTPPPAPRSPAASRSPRPRTSPTSCSPARCPCGWC